MVSKSKLSLGIIIPMYNEEKGAAFCIDAVMRQIGKQKLVKKLIIVNDGSTDRTLEKLKDKQKKYKSKLSIVTYRKNRGYGAALQQGIQKVINLNLDYILFMDSDLTNDPIYIADFVKEIPKGYDCVKASRYIQGGKMVGIPFKRKLSSLIGSVIVRNLFRIGIKDCTNGFRMIKLAKIKNIHFQENNFSIILEELYYLKKYNAKFFEIPTILTTRKKGISHFNYTPTLLYCYLKYSILALLVKYD